MSFNPDPLEIVAGTVTASTGTLYFSNANGVSFGISAGTLTASAAGGGGGGGAALSAGTQSGNTGTVVFSNSNGISFGMSGSSLITASYTVPTQTAFVLSNSNNVSFGTNGSTVTASASFPAATSATFSNSNNVTFGVNAGTVTASASFPAQTTQPAVNAAAGTQTATSGTVVWSNSNGISFGMSNSSVVTASVSSVVFSNSNGVTFGLNASTLTASVSVQTQGVQAVQGGTQTATSGTVIFSNSNGISFGLSNSSVMTASYTVPTQTVQSYNVLAAGTQTANTTGSVVFSNSNNVSFGMSNSSVITASASYSQSTSPAGIAVAGSTLTNGTLVFSNSNGVTFGMNGSTLTVTVTPGAAAGIAGLAINAATTFTSGTVVFSNSNGVTFGTNAQTVTASVAAQTTQPAINAAAGTQTATSGTVVWSNSNGISFGMSNSSVITASYTVPTQTVQTWNVAAAGTQTAATSGTVVFSNSNNVTFGMSNSSVITASISVPAVSAISGLAVNAATTYTSGTVVFSNANNVTFGTNAQTITASASYSQSTSPAGVAVAGSTVTNGTVVFSNSNGVTFGMNGSTITATVTPGAAAGIGAAAAGTQTQTSGTLAFANSNGVTFGMSGSSQVTASVNSAVVYGIGVSTDGVGNTGSATGTFWFSDGGGNLQFSQVTSNNGSNTVNIQVQAVAGAVPGTTVTSGTIVWSNSNGISFGLNGSTMTAAQAPLSRFEPYGGGMVSNTAYTSNNVASWTVVPVILLEPVAFSRINMFKSFNVAIASATSAASTGTQAWTHSQNITIFTRNGYGASSTQLSYLTKASWAVTAAFTYGSTSQAFLLTWITDSAGGTQQLSTTSNSSNIASFGLGPRMIQIPFVTTLTQGEYFFAFGQSSSSGTTNSNVTLMSVSNLHFTNQSISYGLFGLSTNQSFSSLALDGAGYGVASALTTNATMAISVISANVASGQRPIWNGSNVAVQTA